MAKEHRITHNGNRIEVQFDGKVVGLLQNIRMSDEYGHEPASGIGDAHAQEYVPGMARHSLSASTMILFSKNLRDLNIAMENADEVLQGLVFDIAIYGKDPNGAGLLRKYLNCTFTGGDVEINKHAIMVANAQFVALDVTGGSI